MNNGVPKSAPILFALLVATALVSFAYTSGSTGQSAAVSASQPFTPPPKDAGNDCGNAVPKGRLVNEKGKTRAQWSQCIGQRCWEGIASKKAFECPNFKDNLCKKYCYTFATSLGGVINCCQVTESGNGCTKLDGSKSCAKELANTPKQGPSIASCYGTRACGDNPNSKDSTTDTRGQKFDPSKDFVVAVGKGSQYKYGDQITLKTDYGEVTATVRDYCPKCGTDKIDITGAAAQQLGFDQQKGVVPIQVTAVNGIAAIAAGEGTPSAPYQDSSYSMYNPALQSPLNGDATFSIAQVAYQGNPSAPWTPSGPAYVGSLVQPINTFSAPADASFGSPSPGQAPSSGIFQTAYYGIQSISRGVYDSVNGFFRSI